MKTKFLAVALIVSFVTGSGPFAVAADPSDGFSQFRGFGGSGVASTAAPVTWGEEENLAWSAEIPGGGWSSPVVAGNRIFVTTAVSDEFAGPSGFADGVSSMRSFYQSKPPQKPMSFEVHCLSLEDGSQLWKTQVALRKPEHKIHPSNSYATESPATDGKHVFAYFAAVGVVACLDLEGNLVWNQDIGSYATSSDFGTGSSLAATDGRVFVQCDNEENSFLCAFQSESGEELWRVKRDSRTSWSSPVVWKNRERTELVVCGSGNVTSYDPANGNTLWRLTGTGGSYSASPTSDDDRIYFGNSGRSSRGPLVAISAGASGELDLDSLDKGVAWVEEQAGPGMSSPVVVEGRLYVLSRGILTCYDAKNGEQLYRSRLRDASSVTASLWAAGGKVFALNESGGTAVIQPGDDFKLIGSNSIPGLYWSTPSLTDNALLIREASRLHCVRNPQG